MTLLRIPTDHEHVQVKPGRRTGLPVMIAVHSTLLGPAIGGLRIKTYEASADGLTDCLRLSQAMTYKAAAIDNGTGGGKAVVPLPPGVEFTREFRESILLDVAEHVHSLDGAYIAGPDVGTGPEDMDFLYRRTPWVGGRSKAAGGAGGTTYGTFAGLDAALGAAIDVALEAKGCAGLHVSIVGLGGIGTLLAETMAARGARLILSDIDTSRKKLSDHLDATWVTPEEAVLAECDVLAPCALGGVFTAANVDQLRCKVICGAANNQLAHDELATALLAKGIAYVPDFIANAGGLMFAVGVEVHHRNESASEARTREGVSRNVRSVLLSAKENGTTPLSEALALGQARLDAARAR